MRSCKRPSLKDKKDLKVLLINPFGIGDLLFSTSLIGILKRSLPGASLYYICNKRTYNAIEKCPDLKEVFVFEKDDYKALWKKSKIGFLKDLAALLKRIRREKFDLAIDMSMGHQYSFFLMLIGIPERVGFNYKGRGRFLTSRLKFDSFANKPIAEYYKDLLRLIGIDVYIEPTKIWWDKEDDDYISGFLKKEGVKKDDSIVGIAPGGGVSFGKKNLNFKRWPYKKFAVLAELLINNTGSKVILLWGPGEEKLIDDIKGLMKNKPIIAPPTTIRQLASLMSKCKYVITNDAGPLHVAVAAGSRTVSIFGPSDQNVYGPYPRSRRHIVVASDVECRPCYKRFKIPQCSTLKCLNGLDHEKVFGLIKEHRDEKISV